MAKTYTVVISDAEDKALAHVVVSPQEWIDNAVKNRCRIVMEDIVAKEVKRLLDAGQTVSGSQEDIVLNAPIKSLAEQDTKKGSN
jgi:hypothetical protein